MIRYVIVAFVAVILSCACGPRGPAVTTRPVADELPSPTPLAPLEDKHRAACAGLARAGCKEARPASGACEDNFRQAEAYRENVRWDCYAGAQTPDVVRTCGGAGYYTVRCQP